MDGAFINAKCSPGTVARIEEEIKRGEVEALKVAGCFFPPPVQRVIAIARKSRVSLNPTPAARPALEKLLARIDSEAA